VKLDPEEQIIAVALDQAERDDACERGAGARIESEGRARVTITISRQFDAQATDGLPDVNTARWTARRKMSVLRAAAAGQITAEEIARRYAISPEELDTWSRDYAERGLFGLQERGRIARRRRPRSAEEAMRRVAVPDLQPWPRSARSIRRDSRSRAD
jgi:transposase-like protein